MAVEHIPDEHHLYRRIHPEQLKPNGEISTAAFTPNETSVDWEKYTTPQETLSGLPDYHLASILAKVPRKKNLEVKHNPIDKPTEVNCAHSLIIGRKTLSIKKYLREKSTLIVKSSNISS
jgi:hypothetical protein